MKNAARVSAENAFMARFAALPRRQQELYVKHAFAQRLMKVSNIADDVLLLRQLVGLLPRLK